MSEKGEDKVGKVPKPFKSWEDYHEFQKWKSNLRFIPHDQPSDNALVTAFYLEKMASKRKPVIRHWLTPDGRYICGRRSVVTKEKIAHDIREITCKNCASIIISSLERTTMRRI